MSILSVSRIHKQKERIVEGQLRCQELANYLKRTNSPMQVFLSEDGSGIVKKVVYDSKSDQLIGLVLPIDNKNGMPIPRMFKADSPESIKRHLENPQSSLMHVVVAQPLKEKVAPFVLQLFGTDNRFKTEDVLKRWIHTEKELKRFVEN